MQPEKKRRQRQATFFLLIFLHVYAFFVHFHMSTSFSSPLACVMQFNMFIFLFSPLRSFHERKQRRRIRFMYEFTQGWLNWERNGPDGVFSVKKSCFSIAAVESYFDFCCRCCCGCSYVLCFLVLGISYFFPLVTCLKIFLVEYLRICFLILLFPFCTKKCHKLHRRPSTSLYRLIFKWWSISS